MASSEGRSARSRRIGQAFWIALSPCQGRAECAVRPRLRQLGPQAVEVVDRRGLRLLDGRGRLGLGRGDRDGFVATLPEVPRESVADSLQETLGSLRKLVQRGEIRTAALFFRDGLHIEFRRFDRLRVWRTSSPHLRVSA